MGRFGFQNRVIYIGCDFARVQGMLNIETQPGRTGSNGRSHLLGITRQTLWRWRQAGLVPAGAKYRDHLLVFTDDEVVLIREYAQRVIPVGPPPARGRSDT